jgi:hypothetical protein
MWIEILGDTFTDKCDEAIRTISRGLEWQISANELSYYCV